MGRDRLRNLGILAAFCISALARQSHATISAEENAGRRYYYEDIFEPFFAKDERGGRFCSQRPGASPSCFSARKGADTVRVFVIGGSIALRYMQGEENLGYALRKVLPSKRIEALDCGMAGYDSYREALILEEVLDYEPDLVVLLTGHNELLGHAPPPLWLLHAQDRLMRLSLYREFVGRVKPWLARRRPNEEKAIAEREQAFESNLSEMIRRAKNRGVPIAVASPPLNYRDAAPRLNPVQGSRDFLAGWSHYLRREDAMAVETWSRLLSSSPTAEDAPLTLFYLGRAEERLGRQPSANAHYEQALAADRLSGSRCLPDCQELIRKTAYREGAIWLDIDGAFRRKASPHLPGLDMFTDTVHWIHRCDLLASAAVIDALRHDLRLGAWPWDEKRLAALMRDGERAQGSIDETETLASARYAFQELEGEERGERQISWRAVVYLEAVRQRRPGWFVDPARLARRLEAEPAQGGAWGMSPLKVSLDKLYWYLGELGLLRGDWRGASADFARVLSLNAGLRRALLSRAIASTLAGDTRDAVGDLEDALQEDDELLPAAGNIAEAFKLGPLPGILIERAERAAAGGDAGAALDLLRRAETSRPGPTSRHRMALVYQTLEHYPKAVAIFKQLAREDPKSARWRSDLGQCEYFAGAPGAAIDDLRAAIVLDPGFLPAYLSLGAIREQRRDYEGALRVYDLALSASPNADQAPLRDAISKARGAILAELDSGRK